MSGDSGRRWSRSAGRVMPGFTLIEVMIVIAIVLALSTLVGLAVLGRKKDADKDLTRVDIQRIGDGMKLFVVDFGRFPTDEEGVKVLWDKSALSADADQGKWKGYLDKPLPMDRWNHAWVYKQAGEHGEGTYDLSSSGPDGQAGNDDDITSWAGGSAGGTGSTGSNEEAPPPASKGSSGG